MICSVLYEFDSEKALVSKRQVNFCQPSASMVHSPYSPSYDSSNIPMFEIYSWKMVIYGRKIAAIILYIVPCYPTGQQSLVWIFIRFLIANITLTHKLLEMHGWVISTAAVDALVIKHNTEYVISYASKQLQNWYHSEQNKRSEIINKSK